VACGWFYYVERRINREPGMGYSARLNLIDAARWLSAQPAATSPVFTDFSSSSNVLPWLDRRLKLLIDTNSFAIGEEWFRQVMEVTGGRREHREFFARAGVNTVLLRVSRETQELVWALRSDEEWALVYVDPHAVIFVRRTSGTRTLIAAHSPGPESVDVEAWVGSTGGLRYHRALSIATMGGVPYTLGWFEPAARLFEEALRLTPDSAPTWGYLAACHMRLANEAEPRGDAEARRSHLREAVRCLEHVVALEPDDPGAREKLAGVQRLLESAR
jgi:hypothetical protein